MQIHDKIEKLKYRKTVLWLLDYQQFRTAGLRKQEEVRSMEIKITYIKHSSFSVELEDSILIFDYYKGKLPAFSRSKKIYIFASHSHFDHYNACIFDVFDMYENVTYILSNDIAVKEKEISGLKIGKNMDKLYFVKPNDTISIDDLSISTLKSTDEGVAFIINVNDISIYHAGDLNWWNWNGEPEVWNKNMEKNYKTEIEKIKGRFFKLAFIPLDGRLGDKYALGLDYFVKNTQSEYVFPMHCFGNYRVIKQLKEASFASDYIHSIMLIEEEGQNWILN